MKLKNEIAVIFSNLEYSQIPYSRLQQLDKLGLRRIYILLNDREFHEAMQSKINVYGDDEPRSIFYYYQSASENLDFEVINTGNAKTEEEKLQFYLNTVQDQYVINIYLCKESSPLISEALRAKPFLKESRTYPLFPFFNKTERIIPPPSMKPCTTASGLALVQRDINPCLCYQMAAFDLIQYQWLYNIFVELISLNLPLDGQLTLDNLFKEYKDSIIKLEDAELAFEQSHQEIYGTKAQPGSWDLENHRNNTQIKEVLKAKIPHLMHQLIDYYVGEAAGVPVNFTRLP